jgi:ribosome-associated toxin RatA of RatAB toxin-antitoxin module
MRQAARHCNAATTAATPAHTQRARARRYSPEQLYEVVSGVQHYAQFVPWCVRSTVLKRTADGRYLEAELQIGFQMISER